MKTLGSRRCILVESAYRSLLIPAVLSAISFATTFYVFDRLEKSSTFHADESDEAGFLRYSRNDIERRSKSRLLWQAVESGAKIYYGDAVRTAPRAEGNVQLVQGDTVITLEPNSLIVLERAQGQLQLNLLSGSLLVDARGDGKSGKGGGKGPVIKAGKTTVEIGKGTQLSMSKSQGAEANIAVVKGQAAVQAGGKAFKVDAGQTGIMAGDGMRTEANIEVLAPAANAVVLLNHLKDRRLAFTFKPLKADLRVSLEMGPSRSELIATGASTSGAAGALAAQVPSDVFYWRLVAKDVAGRTLSTSVPMRAEGMFVAAPELFSPDAAAMLATKPGLEQLTFSWAKIPQAERLRLQVSTHASFSQPIINRDFTDSSEFTTVMPAEGAYFWRVIAHFPGVKIPVTSATRRFQIRATIALTPPKLITPDNRARLMAADAKQGVVLVWDETPAATGYEITVTPKGGTPLKQAVAGPPYRLQGSAPGEYRWTVRATLGATTSKWAAARQFYVEKAVALRWTVNAVRQMYTGEKATVQLRWQTPPAHVSQLRLRFVQGGGSLAGAPSRDVTGTAVKVTLPGDGNFQFALQGLTAKGDVVAVSQPLTIDVQRQPELDAPVLITQSGSGPLKASTNGDAALRWQPVEGAKSYLISVKHVPTGKVKELKSQQPKVDLDALQPGQYEVTLRAVGQGGKAGRLGRPRALVVPTVSNVAPPEALEIKVY